MIIKEIKKLKNKNKKENNLQYLSACIVFKQIQSQTIY